LQSKGLSRLFSNTTVLILVHLKNKFRFFFFLSLDFLKSPDSQTWHAFTKITLSKFGRNVELWGNI